MAALSSARADAPILVLLSVLDKAPVRIKTIDVLAIFYVPETPAAATAEEALRNATYAIDFRVLTVPRVAFESAAIARALRVLSASGLASHLSAKRRSITICVGSDAAMRNPKRLQSEAFSGCLVRAVDPRDLDACMYLSAKHGEFIQDIKQWVCDTTAVSGRANFKRSIADVPLVTISDHVLSLWPRGLVEAVAVACHTDQAVNPAATPPLHFTVFATVAPAPRLPLYAHYRATDQRVLFPMTIGFCRDAHRPAAAAAASDDDICYAHVSSTKERVAAVIRQYTPTGPWQRITPVSAVRRHPSEPRVPLRVRMQRAAQTTTENPVKVSRAKSSRARNVDEPVPKRARLVSDENCPA